jgi:hypothetical protein
LATTSFWAITSATAASTFGTLGAVVCFAVAGAFFACFAAASAWFATTLTTAAVVARAALSTTFTASTLAALA